MGSCVKRLHAASFLRLIHYTQDFVFRDHQVLITGKVYKNRVSQLCTEQGQHTNQKVVHHVQCPCDPGCIGQQDNQRARQPTQNTKDRTNRKHFWFVHKADPGKLPHGVDNSFVLHTAYTISSESLNTRNILNNAADVLRTNIVLFFSIFPYHAERKP